MSQIVFYLVHRILVLPFYTDVVLTLSISIKVFHLLFIANWPLKGTEVCEILT